jgi:predicted Fe-S protein YdhL (DUF1289 family)
MSFIIKENKKKVSNSNTDYTSILSPCNNQCQTDVDNTYCISCFRTIAEKKQWWKFTLEEKKAIIEDLPLRAKRW